MAIKMPVSNRCSHQSSGVIEMSGSKADKEVLVLADNYMVPQRPYLTQ